MDCQDAHLRYCKCARNDPRSHPCKQVPKGRQLARLRVFERFLYGIEGDETDGILRDRSLQDGKCQCQTLKRTIRDLTTYHYDRCAALVQRTSTFISHDISNDRKRVARRRSPVVSSELCSSLCEFKRILRWSVDVTVATEIWSAYRTVTNDSTPPAVPPAISEMSDEPFSPISCRHIHSNETTVGTVKLDDDEKKMRNDIINSNGIAVDRTSGRFRNFRVKYSPNISRVVLQY